MFALFPLAARMIYTAQTQFEDIENQTLIDLGIGTGMLSIASCLLGADHVFGFDCDPEALALSQTNIDEFELQSNIDLIQADLRRIRLPIDSRRIRAETIVMNPPFGTKPFSTAPEDQDEFSSIGIDMHFLHHASRLATHSIYSLHKTTTREHIVKKAKEWKMKMDVVAVLQFEIPKLEKKRAHKKTTSAPLKSIEVDFIRFEIKDDWFFLSWLSRSESIRVQINANKSRSEASLILSTNAGRTSADIATYPPTLFVRPHYSSIGSLVSVLCVYMCKLHRTGNYS